MTVREAERDDLGEIEAMISELATYEQAAGEVCYDSTALAGHLFGPDPAAGVLIATPDDDPDAVAGMAVWFGTFSTWLGRSGVWLEDLFVRPRYRRLGLATQLLVALGERSEGRVEWAVLDWNDAAISFYDRFGASPVEGWTRYRWLPGHPV